MSAINSSVKFILDLAKTQTVLSRRLDKGLGGLGFNEFLIMFHISQSAEQKMRRVDLAEKVGLSASGVTRLLLPMEKIGLVKSDQSQQDARERLVFLAPGGKQKFKEAMERMEIFVEAVMPVGKNKDLKQFSDFLADLGGRTLMS